jgi:serine/threonine protein kinase
MSLDGGMRSAEGSDLATLLSTGGGLELGHVLAIAGQVAVALDSAHARGLVHSDVKPANILLQGDRAVLSEPGGAQAGAADYAPPERTGPRADVYALGCVIWECLTGRPPYLRGDAAATVRAHRDEPYPPVRELRPDLPEALDAVLARALEKDPARRWASAGELMRAARGSASRT